MELIEVIISLSLFFHGWQRGDFAVFLELLSLLMGSSVGNVGGDPRQAGMLWSPTVSKDPEGFEGTSKRGRW